MKINWGLKNCSTRLMSMAIKFWQSENWRTSYLRAWMKVYLKSFSQATTNNLWSWLKCCLNSISRNCIRMEMTTLIRNLLSFMCRKSCLLMRNLQRLSLSSLKRLIKIKTVPYHRKKSSNAWLRSFDVSTQSRFFCGTNTTKILTVSLTSTAEHQKRKLVKS